MSEPLYDFIDPEQWLIHKYGKDAVVKYADWLHNPERVRRLQRHPETEVLRNIDNDVRIMWDYGEPGALENVPGSNGRTLLPRRRVRNPDGTFSLPLDIDKAIDSERAAWQGKRVVNVKMPDGTKRRVIVGGPEYYEAQYEAGVRDSARRAARRSIEADLEARNNPASAAADTAQAAAQATRTGATESAATRAAGGARAARTARTAAQVGESIGTGASRIMPKIGSGLRSSLSFVAENPLLRLGIIGAGLATLGKGIYDAYNIGDEMSKERNDVDYRNRLISDADELARNANLKRFRQHTVDQNIQRLAMEAPDLYQSVMAGRRLPQGAVVIGGRPRTDLMNELGNLMSTPGSF